MAEGNGGYIKVYRKLLDNDVFKDPHALHVWIYLLLEANWKDVMRLDGKVVKRGSLRFAVQAEAPRFGLTRKQLRLIIEKLAASSMVVTEGASKYTLVSICQYDTYQSSENAEVCSDSKGHQRATKVTENGPPEGHQKGNQNNAVTGDADDGCESDKFSLGQPDVSKTGHQRATRGIENGQLLEEARTKKGRKKKLGTNVPSLFGNNGQAESEPKTHPLMDVWNEKASQHPGILVTVRKLTPKRAAKIRTRIKDPSFLATFSTAIRHLPIYNHQGFIWQPDFDWIVSNDTNVHKLNDGYYDQRSEEAQAQLEFQQRRAAGKGGTA